jgi:hypothetical protein
VLEESSHDLGGELRAAVADELKREAMESENFIVIDVGYTFGCDVGVARKGMNEFAVVVGEYNNGVVTIGFGELCDEVDTN